MKWTDGITCYPESFDEIATVIESRKARDSHPAGAFDKAGRWYPAESETASCCKAINSPSRAHPYSYMVHCRTRKHVQTWYAEHATCVRCGARLDALERIGAGRTCNDCLSAPAPDTSNVNLGKGVGLGVGIGYYAIYTASHPTIEQLKARRAECLMFALGMHRRILRAHPRDTSITEWESARRYWTEQAYHAHGEIMARLERPEFPVYYDAQGCEHESF